MKDSRLLRTAVGEILRPLNSVIPAKAGIQFLVPVASKLVMRDAAPPQKNWIPAFAGMTALEDSQIESNAASSRRKLQDNRWLAPSKKTFPDSSALSRE